MNYYTYVLLVIVDILELGNVWNFRGREGKYAILWLVAKATLKLPGAIRRKTMAGVF
jgi:hypothetical protein